MFSFFLWSAITDVLPWKIEILFVSTACMHPTKSANMTSKVTRRVYPVYVPPPIEVVVQDPIINCFHEKVSKIAETKFAQAINDFANDFAQALTLSFAELPTTIQDLKEPDECVPKNAKPTAHDRLSLAEMGLSGYNAPKKSVKVTPIPEQAFLSQV